MPIYEYECIECGEVFERLQKVSDPPPEGHDCGSKLVRRVMSRSSFILKGDGWYVTDYARKGRKEPKREGETGTDTGTDKKSDSSSSSDTGSKSDKELQKSPKADAA